MNYKQKREKNLCGSCGKVRVVHFARCVKCRAKQTKYLQLKKLEKCTID